MGSITLIIIIGHKIYYKGIGVLKNQQHIPSEKRPKAPPHGKVRRGGECLMGAHHLSGIGHPTNVIRQFY